MAKYPGDDDDPQEKDLKEWRRGSKLRHGVPVKDENKGETYAQKIMRLRKQYEPNCTCDPLPPAANNTIRPETEGVIALGKTDIPDLFYKLKKAKEDQDESQRVVLGEKKEEPKTKLGEADEESEGREIEELERRSKMKASGNKMGFTPGKVSTDEAVGVKEEVEKARKLGTRSRGRSSKLTGSKNKEQLGYKPPQLFGGGKKRKPFQNKTDEEPKKKLQWDADKVREGIKENKPVNPIKEVEDTKKANGILELYKMLESKKRKKKLTPDEKSEAKRDAHDQDEAAREQVGVSKEEWDWEMKTEKPFHSTPKSQKLSNEELEFIDTQAEAQIERKKEKLQRDRNPGDPLWKNKIPQEKKIKRINPFDMGKAEETSVRTDDETARKMYSYKEGDPEWYKDGVKRLYMKSPLYEKTKNKMTISEDEVKNPTIKKSKKEGKE
jgi:hypothetical protein